MKSWFLLLLCSSSLYAQELRTVIQKGHARVVKSAIINAEETLLFTASRDKSIKIWDYQSGLEIKTLFGHEHTVNHLELSPDGKFLASTSADYTTRVWEIASGETILTVKGENYMTDVAFSPDGQKLACGGYDWTMSIWDLKTKSLEKKIKVGPEKGLGFGIDLEFSSDGKHLIIGEDNKKARVFSTETWEEVYEFAIEQGFCGGCLAFVKLQPQSGLLYKAEQKGKLRIYDLAKGEKLRDLADIPFQINSLDIHANGKLLLAGEKEIRILDAKSGDSLLSFFPEVQEINEARFSPSGDEILISGNDNKASLFAANDGRFLRDFSGILHLVDRGGLDFDPNNYWQSHIANFIRLKNKTALRGNNELIRGKFGNKLKRWDLYSGRAIREYKAHDKAVLAFDQSPDGKSLITGGGGGKILLWDIDKGDTIRSIGSHRELIFDLRYSHNGRMAASSSWDAYVKVWDLEKGEQMSLLNLNNNSAYTLAFTPNDLYLVLGKLDKTLELWEPDSKTMVRQFIGHTDVVSSLNFTSAGNRMLSASWDGTAREWDLGTGLQTAKFRSNGPMYTAVYSPDEKYVVTGGEDRMVKFWDRSNGDLAFSLEGHEAAISNILFSTDGQLISVDINGVTKIWNPESQKMIFEEIHIGQADYMIRSLDGHFYATDGARKHIHFVKGFQAFQVDQFFDEFFDPKLPKHLRSGEGKRGGASLQQRIQSNPPPEVKLVALTKGSGEEATLRIRVIDMGGGVNALRLYHNGKRIAKGEEALREARRQKGDTTYYVLDIPLINGKNLFQASAINRDQLESAKSEAFLEIQKGTADATCHILAIGINAYKNPKLNLNYAVADASAFVKAFSSKAAQLYKNIDTTTLYDQEASREGILNALIVLEKKADINDVLVIYYAGHGSMVEGDFFFALHESTRLLDRKALEETALSAAEVQQHLQGIRALKQIIIMDACQSGGSVELLAQRGVPEEKAIAQLSRSSGIHVMASAGSDQYATEFQHLGHGLFTYLLLEALEGQADGAPDDNKVTIYELKSFLDDRVPSLSQKEKGSPQYPFTFSRGMDFPLVIVKE